MTALLPTQRAVARIGLIGAGGIGRAHAQATHGLDNARLAAVADVVPSAAAAVAEEFGAEQLDLAELANPKLVDLVVVASPPGTHQEVVEPLLRAGVPVLCEKPLAIDTAAAARLLQLSAETGTPLSMATKFRFVDDVNHTAEIVANGTLGELLKIEVNFAGRVDMTDRWNAVPAVSGGGVLIDNATHGVDLVRHLAGPITEVFAVAGPKAQQLDVEDSATLLARTTSGALAQVDVTWSYQRMHPVYLSVHGTLGSAEVGWKGSRALMIDRSEPYDFGTGYCKIDSLRANLDAVLDALTRGTATPVTSADAVASCAVIDAAYASMACGGWVEVAAV